MATFRFTLLHENGNVFNGTATLPFDDPIPAIRYLERQGGVILRITPLGRARAFLARIGRSLHPVRRKELAETLWNLAMLLASGVPMLTALSDILEDTVQPQLRAALHGARVDIENGRTLSEALERNSEVFSPLLLHLCRIGEETGRLDVMLRNAANHLNHLDQIASATRRALLYPLFLSLVTAGAATFWLIVVVPELTGLFADMNIPLPLLTRALISVADHFRTCLLPAMGIGLLIACILAMLRRRSAGVRLVLDALLLRTPGLRVILETSIIARIAEYLGHLLGAGIGVARSLEIIAAAIGNRVFAKRILEALDNIRGGNTLADALRMSRAMPPYALRMIAVGETSGRLDTQTTETARVYRDKLSALVEVLGKSLEPAMLVILGSIFALIAGGLLLPVYELVGAIQG